MVRAIEQNKEYHMRYLRAMNNSLGREILKTLRNGSANIEDLQSLLKLDMNVLQWHLNML